MSTQPFAGPIFGPFWQFSKRAWNNGRPSCNRGGWCGVARWSRARRCILRCCNCKHDQRHWTILNDIERYWIILNDIDCVFLAKQTKWLLIIMEPGCRVFLEKMYLIQRQLILTFLHFCAPVLSWFFNCRTRKMEKWIRSSRVRQFDCLTYREGMGRKWVGCPCSSFRICSHIMYHYVI